MLRLGGNKQDPYLKLTLQGTKHPTLRTKAVRLEQYLLLMLLQVSYEGILAEHWA
jgi:hypothetical protein